VNLGISSYTYTWAIGVPQRSPENPLDVFGLLDKAGQLDVTVLQVADNLPLDRLSATGIDTLHARAMSAGIDIEVGTRGISPDHLRRYLRLAAQLDSHLLRVVVDTAEHHPPVDEIVEILRGLAQELGERNVVLAIENHDRFEATTFAEIVERVGSDYVGICLDTVNSFGAREGVRETVRVLAPLTVNLHVKDFHIHRIDHQMGFVIEGRPAGQGHLDVPWLLDELRRHGRDPNVIIELWTPPAETLEQTIAREEDWARQSVAYMRKEI
jgi:sugar phosphate isomerase/epimerase